MPCRIFLVPLVALLSYAPVGSSSAQKKELGVESLIYVGTKTGAPSQAKGIYLFRMRTSDNPDIPEFVTLTPLGLVAETSNPTFLEIDAKRGLLFCVNQADDVEGGKSGAVSAFRIDPESGKLAMLNQRASARPCHLAMDRECKHLLVADEDGSITVLPIGSDGKLREATDVKQHEGRSINPGHQTVPRPRGVTLSPDNQFVFVCDLGLDKIVSYRFDSQAGKLTPHDPPFTSIKPGSGPRRMVFRPDGKFAYVICELNSTVTVFAYDAQAGALKELQTISTVPEYYDGPNQAAEIGVHPSGKFLLVSNCGHHSVVLFSIDPDKGTLTYVEDQSTYGTMPRHFNIETAGKHVVVANQESGSILILRAPESARVKPGGMVVKTPSPTCAKFLPK